MRKNCVLAIKLEPALGVVIKHSNTLQRYRFYSPGLSSITVLAGIASIPKRASDPCSRTMCGGVKLINTHFLYSLYERQKPSRHPSAHPSACSEPSGGFRCASGGSKDPSSTWRAWDLQVRREPDAGW